MNRYFIILLALLCASCGSSSKFAAMTEGNKGALFVSANLDVPVMAAAVKYGFEKMNIALESETRTNENTMVMAGTLKSSMQDWGQYIKMTIVKNEATTEIWFFSSSRVAMNVTADVVVIRDNLRTHVSLYIEAAKEGLDLNTIDLTL